MARRNVKGLFVTGTDTGVGKTYVAALIARNLVDQGCRVGVYKPAASGCRMEQGTLVSDDAVALWQAAGRPGELAAVCPQRFAAPLAPHLAAKAEGRRIDEHLLRSGLDYWLARSDVVLVEGAGGLLSPLSHHEYVADVAYDLGFPLVVTARNRLGVINQTLQTLAVAATFRRGLSVAAVVLCDTEAASDDDPSLASNGPELARRITGPVLAELGFQQAQFEPAVDWLSLSKLG
jgi:dethiobiotin synthetase